MYIHVDYMCVKNKHSRFSKWSNYNTFLISCLINKYKKTTVERKPVIFFTAAKIATSFHTNTAFLNRITETSMNETEKLLN